MHSVLGYRGLDMMAADYRLEHLRLGILAKTVALGTDAPMEPL